MLGKALKYPELCVIGLILGFVGVTVGSFGSAVSILFALKLVSAASNASAKLKAAVFRELQEPRWPTPFTLRIPTPHSPKILALNPTVWAKWKFPPTVTTALRPLAR
jgi:hypothetical protein